MNPGRGNPKGTAATVRHGTVVASFLGANNHTRREGTTMRRFLREFDFIKGVKTGALALARLAASLLAVQPAEAADRYFLTVVNEQGDTGVGAVGRCRVLTTGTTTDATVYTTSTLATSVTNPVALGSDGECSWWGATSTTYDVIVVIDSGTYKGSRVHVAGVTAQTARKVLVTRSSAEKVLMIPYSGTTAATVTDTRTFPAGAVAPADVSRPGSSGYTPGSDAARRRSPHPLSLFSRLLARVKFGQYCQARLQK